MSYFTELDCLYLTAKNLQGINLQTVSDTLLPYTSLIKIYVDFKEFESLQIINVTNYSEEFNNSLIPMALVTALLTSDCHWSAL